MLRYGTFVLVLLLAGCNHLYYFPTREIYATPDKVDTAYDAFRVKVGGEELAVWHLKPRGPDQKIVVLHFHGNGENMTSHFLLSGWMTRAGFDVVTFDYRGYGASTGSPSRDGLIEDGQAMLKWIADKPNLKGKRLVVFGQSLGGAVAVPVAALAPKGQVKLLVVDSTFASYRRIARGVLSNFWVTWPFQWPLSFLVSDGYSPEDYIGRIEVPFLAMHAPGDMIVPYAYGRDLFDKARMADKTFWKIELSGHTSAFREDDSVYRDQFVRYVCQRLASPCSKK